MKIKKSLQEKEERPAKHKQIPKLVTKQQSIYNNQLPTNQTPNFNAKGRRYNASNTPSVAKLIDEQIISTSKVLSKKSFKPQPQINKKLDAEPIFKKQIG